MADNQKEARDAVQKSDEVFAAERKEDINVLIIVGVVFLLALLFPNQLAYIFKDLLYFM